MLNALKKRRSISPLSFLSAVLMLAMAIIWTALKRN